ncbi:prephenate dehydratase [Tumidithrix elongata RA019]|uniref:Prephenate dehydratase n=1 Tax=Tumidithrix elongata BACA0141 TaxID=2716417 RepID=A0AAW9PYC6_9CYAN|nr:prephenate dehydratase [Tumidithrix elongata RA019]
MTAIAYLGPSGTYAEAAALKYQALYPHLHPESKTSPILCPYPSIPKAIQAAALKEVDLAIVPVENSIQGGVTMTLDSLWQWHQLQIQQALVLPIEHALITQAKTLADIKVVYSHPQALAQCQHWLEEFVPQAQLVPTDSTTEGLEVVSTDSTLAAIASQRAAEMYKLPTLACPINDHPDNCTRFWVLGLTPPTTKGSHTSLAFSAQRNLPGALVKPLSVFADLGINLSRIESRPTKRSLGDYVFFIDIEASVEQPFVQEALQDLVPLTETLRIFGSYSIAD